MTSVGLDTDRRERDERLLRAAEGGDVVLVKSLLKEGADAWYEDRELGWSALHYAAERGDNEIVKTLLRHGGVWNAVDLYGITAAEVAWSANHTDVYMTLLGEGVRTTLIQAALLEQDADCGNGEEEIEDFDMEGTSGSLRLVADSKDLVNDNQKFLKSRLTFIKDEEGKERCLDEDGNMVMAAWETDIMERSARLLCEGQSAPSVLNIGFGLGIIDTALQRYNPKRHVIIEAHPDAIAHLRELGWDKRPNVEIYEGRWEDVVNDPTLGDFDAVYWDTYSEDYKELRKFFDVLPNLLSGPTARFSFFHGLAGTNPFFYDVFTSVCEIDLKDVGLSTRWETLRPALTEETWRGVLRKYWTLQDYHLPLCTMG